MGDREEEPEEDGQPASAKIVVAHDEADRTHARADGHVRILSYASYGTKLRTSEPAKLVTHIASPERASEYAPGPAGNESVTEARRP